MRTCVYACMNVIECVCVYECEGVYETEKMSVRVCVNGLGACACVRESET